MKNKRITAIVLIAILGLVLPIFGTVVTTIYSGLNTNVTCTLASLGSAAARQCTMVNNNTQNDVENHVYISFKTNAAGTNSTGNVVVYIAPCVGAVASVNNCAGAGEVTGTDSAITIPTTPAYPLAAGFSATCPAYLNGTVYRCGFSVASTFLGHQPSGYVVIVLNNSGAAFDASCNSGTSPPCGVFIDRVRLQNQ